MLKTHENQILWKHIRICLRPIHQDLKFWAGLSCFHSRFTQSYRLHLGKKDVLQDTKYENNVKSLQFRIPYENLCFFCLLYWFLLKLFVQKEIEIMSKDKNESHNWVNYIWVNLCLFVLFIYFIYSSLFLSFYLDHQKSLWKVDSDSHLLRTVVKPLMDKRWRMLCWYWSLLGQYLMTDNGTDNEWAQAAVLQWVAIQ